MRRLLLLMPFLVVFVAGCATTESGSWSRTTCALIGGAGGAALGAIDSAGAAGAGAAIGGLIGYWVCNDPDTDGDGIPDSVDKCPSTPLGAKVDGSGCAIDSDGDGVPDFRDKCPDTPAGVKVDDDGCPLDSDGDGVPDYLDKCPGTPPGTMVDEFGCPPAKVGSSLDLPGYCGNLVELTGDRVTGFKHVLFAFDSDELTPEGQAILDCVAIVLEQQPSKMGLNGYTCSVGDEEYNLRLSQRRAHSSRDYLLSKGVAESTLELNWYGEGNPAWDNDDLNVRRLNRRVEIIPR